MSIYEGRKDFLIIIWENHMEKLCLVMFYNKGDRPMAKVITDSMF